MAEQREVRQAGGSETKQETWGEQCEPVPLNNGSPEELLPPDGARRSIGIFRYAILRLREKITRYFIQMFTTNPALRQITAVIAAQVTISLVFETLLLDKKDIEKDFNQFLKKLATGIRNSLPEGVVLKSKIVTDLSEVPESGDYGTLLVVCKKAKGGDNNHYGIYIYYYYNSQNERELVYQNFKNSPRKPLNQKLNDAKSEIESWFKQNSNNGNDGGNRNNRGDDNNRNNRGDGNNRKNGKNR